MDVRVGLPPSSGHREQLAELDLRGTRFRRTPWRASSGSEVALCDQMRSDGPIHRPTDVGIRSGPRLADHGYQNSWWGGWGSNPRPADYEKYGPTLRVRCLHGYHGAVAPMALIAPFARMTRSTNRSTPYHGGHRMPATERYRRQGLICQGCAGGSPTRDHRIACRSRHTGPVSRSQPPPYGYVCSKSSKRRP